MFISFVSKFCRTLTGTLCFFLFVSGQIGAQVVASSDDVVRQSNTALTALADNGRAATAGTRTMLSVRHEHLIQIFRDSPEKARSYALSAKTREALLQAEPGFAVLIEQDAPLTGELTSSVADDFVHHTATEQYSLRTAKGDRSLSFVTVRDDLHRLLHHQITVTGLSLPEIVAAETLREASPREVNAAHAAIVSATSENLEAAVGAISITATSTFTGPGVAPGAATLIEIPLGLQTTAVLILKFAAGTVAYPTGLDQQSIYNQTFNGPAVPNVNSYMNEVSYGQTSVAADVYGPITVPGNFDCNTSDALATAAITAGIGAGLDVSKYNHYVFVFPVSSCYYGGLGSTGPNAATALIPHQNTYIWLPISPFYDMSADIINFLWYAASNHEFGHNLGLNHANSIDFGTLTLGPLDYVEMKPGVVTPGGHAPAVDSATASALALSPAAVSGSPNGSTAIKAINTEYGDLFADMGDGQGVFSGQHHVQELGWIPPSGSQDVTSSGSFSIFPTETNSGLRTLHVLRDPISSSWIWVEFHQPIGIYTPRSETQKPLNVTPNTLYTGAQLHYQNGFGDQLHTLLMDMTPTTNPTLPNNFFDGNLAPGASWSDLFSLLTITAGTQSSSSLGVSISYDAPCATVSLGAPTLPAAGGAGAVTLQAPASCSWSVSSNASWITFSSATTGTGNGTVTFNATANTGTGQRNSYLTAQRQSLPLIQESTGITLVGLKSAAGKVAPNVELPIVLNLQDANGAADISEIDITIVGGTSPDCKIATSSADASSVFIFLSTNGQYSDAKLTGSANTLTNGSCTIDLLNSSYSGTGKKATFTLAVSFPASFTGIHSITGSASGSTLTSPTLPLGFVNVTSLGAAPALAINPNSASAPLSGVQGTTVPFTITGTNTSFNAATTLQIGGTGVTVGAVNVVNSTTLTGSLVVSTNAVKGARPVTVTSGSQVLGTTFTVNAANIPSITLSPSSGLKGATVAVTIAGTGTNFTAASTVAISGTRIKVDKVTYVSPTSITATFVLASDTESDPRTVTVTSGSEIDTASFTVTPDVTREVFATPATGNQGDSTFVTFTGINTHFTDATTVGIPGTDIKIRDINVVNGLTLTVKFAVDSTATAGARVVNITTGTENVKGTFTVTAYAPTATTIVAADAAITETTGTTLTITVAPTSGAGKPTGYVSVIEHKGGAGLEDILGTVALSGGKASLPISNLAVGVHSFSAQYLGDNAAFAPSNSTANAIVTVTADAGTVVLAETATLQRLPDGSYEAIVLIANSGNGTATNVQLTSASLGGTIPAQAFPVALPDIAPGGSISALSFFPAGAGTPGTATVLKFTGTYKGGNFSGSIRVTLP